MIHFLAPAAYDWTILDYLANRGRSIAGRFRILHYEDLPSRVELEAGVYVLSGFHWLPPVLLRCVRALHDQLSQAEGIRFLNHPTRSLARFELLQELSRRHLNGFRTARAAGDLTGLRYPVFLRSERRHEGAISGLLESSREIDAAIGRALLLGHALDDLLVIEFCDTADASGRFRKYCAFIVGDRILPRNLEISREWVVKDSCREFTLPAVLEERDYLFGNPHEAALRAIFEAAGTEYGRIDYGVKEGRIQTWEINLHPTIGPARYPSPSRIPEDLQRIHEESRRRFYATFEEAWETADRSVGGGPAALPVRMPTETAIPAPATSGRPRRALRGLRRALRPLRPLLDPLATPVYPILGRRARERRKS